MNAHQEANRRKVAEATRIIIASLNSGGVEEVQAGILDELNSSHRTLQQLFVKATIDALIEYGNNEYYDDRNEASKRYCQTLDVPTFPYI